MRDTTTLPPHDLSPAEADRERARLQGWVVELRAFIAFDAVTSAERDQAHDELVTAAGRLRLLDALEVVP